MSQQFVRAYPAMIEQTGPRQLTGRLVPYDEAAEVLDELPGGGFDVYQEGFRRGAFAPQANSQFVAKINLVHQHGPNGLGYLGPFTALREADDGLYGDARIMPSLADNVTALLEEGVDELSVEFRLPKGNHTIEVDGVRWRTRAHLDQVALEPKGAYSSARVLAFRAELDELQREQAEAQQREATEAEEREAAEAAEREKVAAAEAEAAAAEARRREWDELTARLPDELEKQQQLVREYGVTQPGGFKRDS